MSERDCLECPYDSANRHLCCRYAAGLAEGVALGVKAAREAVYSTPRGETPYDMVDDLDPAAIIAARKDV